jgi:hypothetical protein
VAAHVDVVGRRWLWPDRHYEPAVGADRCEGIVIGVERKPRFIDMAQAEIRERGLYNVGVIRADALQNWTAKERLRHCSRTTDFDQFALGVARRL